MHVARARDDALLVELDGLAQVTALHASLAERPAHGVVETVPGARTLLVRLDPWRVDPGILVADLRTRVAAVKDGGDGSGGRGAPGRLVEIPTVYGGEDLDDVADLLGCSTDEVVRRHTAASWVVGFVGFAPGFAYLLGDDAGLVVPRRPTPRTRVPAGSVALAGPYAGVYPRESPGGWQLVGRTDVVTWDLDRDPPTPWAPGDRVHFSAARASARGAMRPHEEPHERGSSSRERQFELPHPPRTAAPTGWLEVVTPGLQALVQDLGRPGLAHLGVTASGAADPRSLRAANRALGNPVGAAAVEAVGEGLRLRAHGSVVVALAGSDAEVVVHRDGRRGRQDGQDRQDRQEHDAGRVAPRARAFRLDDGDELELGSPARGWRTCVAVRGGVDVPRVLGSRATDVLSGLGPAPLTPGAALRPARNPDVVAVGVHDVGAPDVGALPAADEVTTLPLVLGPHDDWFDDVTALLRHQQWRVTPRSDRVGLRLRADPDPASRLLDRAASYRGRELPSEGTVAGALQVPPDGQPVLFGVDHPLTGGYPVVGAVPTTHLWLLGQLPPGALVRFAPAALDLSLGGGRAG